MEELKVLQEAIKKLTQAIEGFKDKIRPLENDHKILVNEKVGLTQAIKVLNEQIAEIRKEKEKLTEESKGIGDSIVEKAKLKADEIIAQAKEQLAKAITQNRQAQIDLKTADNLISDYTERKARLDAKEEKISKIQETLKSYG